MGHYAEVEFKGRRLDYFGVPDELTFKKNDIVILESDNGIDAGKIHRLLSQLSSCMKKGKVYKIIRKISSDDLDTMRENKIKEKVAKPIAKRLFKKHELNIKLSDIEYQLDRNKITFYFTSDERVDFRELVKELAWEFKARTELRQINAREAARKIGGCGPCGLQLCCTTCILRDFSPVSTQFAKDQMMSAIPAKLTGVCGRLRCCLRYELEMYKEQLTKFPEVTTLVNTPAGKASVEKIDIFKEEVSLRFDDGSSELLPLEDVQLLMRN